MRRVSTLLLVACTALASAPPSSAAGAEPGESWLEQGIDRRLPTAIAANSGKVPDDLARNLEFATQPDGTLRVIVALDRRDTAIEGAMARIVRKHRWYGRDPRFLALVDQEGFAALLEHDAVAFVEPDYPLSYLLATSVVDISGRGEGGVWDFDPSAGAVGTLTSSVPRLGADRLTGKDIMVAVVDSGIDKTHRDFGGWDCTPRHYSPCESRILKSVATEHVLGTAAPDPGDALPTTDIASAHGTHVAGIVAGNGYYGRTGEASESQYGGDGHVMGVAPQASLLSVKAGDGISAALGNEALQWVLDHVDEFDIRVANNSWGCMNGCPYRPDSVLAQIQKDLYGAGVVTVFSAGNAGGTGGGEEFSGISQSPYVLSVASYDDENHKLSDFSSRGRKAAQLPNPKRWTPESEFGSRRPDIAAPGDEIDSARSLTGGTSSPPRVNPADAELGPGFSSYRGGSGTSMSAPHVSGAAAILLSACPKARPLDAMRALFVGANREKIEKTEGGLAAEPFGVGYGALDLASSVRWLLKKPYCRVRA